MDRERAPQPPPPPQLPRRFRPAPHRAVGVALMLLLVLAAVADAFDQRGRALAEGGGLRLAVVYPQRVRATTEHEVTIEVTNVGAAARPSVVLSIERTYLDAFGDVEFTPAEAEPLGEAVVVELPDLAPDETRRVVVALRAESPWSHAGTVSASVPGGGVSVSVRALVFP
jgi:hypothetical protein